MTAVWIVGIVFAGVIALSAIDGYFSLEKRKIDAALRQQEINDGVAPGTYARPYKNKKAYKKAQKEFNEMREKMGSNPQNESRAKTEEEIRAELIKGIQNLQQRIDNIDTIMSSKQEKKERAKNEN